MCLRASECVREGERERERELAIGEFCGREKNKNKKQTAAEAVQCFNVDWPPSKVNTQKRIDGNK